MIKDSLISSDLKEEEKINTGHENEDLIGKIKFVKLYYFGQDVLGEQCWKERASQSTIDFYQCRENGKVRMVAREHKTNKLRMNQFVTIPNQSNFGKKLQQKNVYLWTGYDHTLRGITTWCIRFESLEKADCFITEYKNASIINNGDGPMVKQYDIFLHKFAIIKLSQSVLNDGLWENRANDIVLKIYEDTRCGKMKLVCNDNNYEMNIYKENNNWITWSGINITDDRYYELYVMYSNNNNNYTELHVFNAYKLCEWDSKGVCWKKVAKNVKISMVEECISNKTRIFCQEMN